MTTAFVLSGGAGEWDKPWEATRGGRSLGRRWSVPAVRFNHCGSARPRIERGIDVGGPAFELPPTVCPTSL